MNEPGSPLSKPPKAPTTISLNIEDLSSYDDYWYDKFRAVIQRRVNSYRNQEAAVRETLQTWRTVQAHHLSLPLPTCLVLEVEIQFQIQLLQVSAPGFLAITFFVFTLFYRSKQALVNICCFRDCLGRFCLLLGCHKEFKNSQIDIDSSWCVFVICFSFGYVFWCKPIGESWYESTRISYGWSEKTPVTGTTSG